MNLRRKADKQQLQNITKHVKKLQELIKNNALNTQKQNKKQFESLATTIAHHTKTIAEHKLSITQFNNKITEQKTHCGSSDSPAVSGYRWITNDSVNFISILASVFFCWIGLRISLG